ncbi:restnoid-inducible serine carboxypeptidase, putative [Perkinsus marinus ATCC 50983]|uniref:Restnoid-inducible serine carboxypeptidase, putative n=1 Tax=Perkinsus marinus (strain ATCC 50983 / TXsc) TaxID=423536 RepID=C5KF57_PERM5|nr:restnoid-inducible serine carboxypeptidase, putative [Perkinsus marinus ATCC 50983]EER16859.1 restnoid-inducible serine carboxypeptidase, putative [Perkinsus marinus ATCC 50983]|eukprot:XP_002785063.1 restnoid-inducible serine carboxypeptidase, putative [Perkinsus marinus ATCC 50983]
MNKIMISILVILGVSRSANVLCPFSKGSQEYGYIQVSKENKYFFAAVEAEEDPKTAPTFLLLQGGLGGSSVGLAMAEGPCFLSPVTGKPELSPYSWTQKANSIWVDAPGPSGFSEGPVEPDLNTVVNYMEKFVSQFFKDHPNFNTKVHIVGLSAAGSIAAMLGSAIVRHKLRIDFKGVMLSSPIIGPGAIARGCVTMAKSLLPPGKFDELL